MIGDLEANRRERNAIRCSLTRLWGDAIRRGLSDQAEMYENAVHRMFKETSDECIAELIRKRSAA